MGYVKLRKLTNVSPFRKVAMGTWNNAKDPQVYSLVELDITGLKEKMEQYSHKHGVRITINHLIGKAYCHAVKVRPEINGMIRGSHLYLREEVALNYLVNVPSRDGDSVAKATLAATTIHKAEEMTLNALAKQLEANVEKVRAGKDPVMSKNMEVFKIMPWWVVKHYLNFASWLIYGLNWPLGFLGIPKDPFGSVMITNVGSLDVDMTWAPLVPYSRIPLVMTICTARERAWVVDGKVVPRLILPIGVCFDHRFIDGVHGAQLQKIFKDCFKNPDKFFFAD